jgi:hypothetical protein
LVSNASANIRAVLHQNPDGMDYDQICRATGIARDKVSSFVAALMGQGDVKPYEIDGRRIFKYAGDPSRVGPRVREKEPASVPQIPRFTATRAVQTEPIVVPPSIPAKINGSPRPDLQALSVENVITAASSLAAAVREHVDMEGADELQRAVRAFELAERIHEAAHA